MTHMVTMPVAGEAPSSSVRLATPDDRSRLAALVHLEPYVHQHPGWYAPLDRVGSPGFVVLERENSNLEAALAVLPETPYVGWVRLFASSASLPPRRAWEILWPEAIAPSLAEGVQWVAVMPFADWFQRLVQEVGFQHLEDVEVLVWENQPLPPVEAPEGLRLRPMTAEDLPTVEAIDVAAFGRFWQMSAEAFRTALARSVWATVVEDQHTGTLVGFQISTPSPLGGHLARLAVHPQAQRRGIGRWLVHDTLSFFRRNHAERVTLNTQGNNEKALALYRRMGFRSTHEVYPVYRYALTAASQEE